MSEVKIFEMMPEGEKEAIKEYLKDAQKIENVGADAQTVDVKNNNLNGQNPQNGIEATQGQNADAQNNNDINEQKIGKFKNPQELLKAYGELEKEFTRKSQKLRELENGKQPLKTDEEWKSAVDKFFNEIPSAKAFAKDIANEILKNPELKEDANCLNVALLRVLTDKFRTPEQLMDDGQFLNDYVFSSEKVRDAVIANYLDGVRRGVPPYTLHSDGMQCVAPKVKPKTIEEAGFMFLKNNK